MRLGESSSCHYTKEQHIEVKGKRRNITITNTGGL
jgi:hypothetical protein